MEAKLERLETSDQGTFGVMTVGELEFFSGELPWRDNRANVSCIPEGIYECTYSYSPKFGKFMYMINSVEGRSGVRIHSGNYAGDTEKGYLSHSYGCPLLGMKRGTMGGQRAVLISRPAISKLERKLGREDFTLEIVNGW